MRSSCCVEVGRVLEVYIEIGRGPDVVVAYVCGLRLTEETYASDRDGLIEDRKCEEIGRD